MTTEVNCLSYKMTVFQSWKYFILDKEYYLFNKNVLFATYEHVSKMSMVLEQDA